MNLSLQHGWDDMPALYTANDHGLCDYVLITFRDGRLKVHTDVGVEYFKKGTSDRVKVVDGR